MRAALLTALLCAATTTHAGLLGPATFDECVAKYVVVAQINEAASGATGWCRTLYPRDDQGATEAYMRRRAQCVLDRVADVQAEAAYQQLVAMCVRNNPQPPPDWATKP